MTDKDIGVDHGVRTADADSVRRTAVDERDVTSPTTAPADSVEPLRRLVRDLKHDVRMLKVVVDKQSALLERLTAQLHRS